MSRQHSNSPEPTTPILGDVFGPEFHYVHDRNCSCTCTSRVSPFSLCTLDVHLSESALQTIEEELRNPGTILPVIITPTLPRAPQSLPRLSEEPLSPNPTVVRDERGWFIPETEVDTERYLETREDPNNNEHLL